MSRMLGVLLLALLGGWPLQARAFPWMIRHGYANCAACHMDPSGGGILNRYGRAQSVLLLTTQYTPRKEGEEAEEVGREADFLYGVVPTPLWLNLEFAFRGGVFATWTGDTTSVRPVQMLTDLRAGLAVGPVRAVGTIGYAARRALPASLTSWEQDNIVSREHWLGVVSPEETLLVRFGRMNLPFGLRNPEHTTWVRDATRTDINEDQQNGLAVAFNAERVRAELMAIVGNFLLNQAYYWEQGYSGYVEWALAQRAAVGVGSLITRARYDSGNKEPFFLRQTHGMFGRWAPVQPVVLLAEAEALLERPQGQSTGTGYVGLLQADWEIIQGVHVMASGELLRRPGVEGVNVGGWLTGAYFFFPRAEVRVDATVRRLESGGGGQMVYTLLGQLHLFL